MNQFNRLQTLLFLFITLLFIACGGENSVEKSSSEDSLRTTQSNSSILKANAGQDKNLTLGSSITLSAEKSLSSGDKIVEYSWSLNSKIISHKAKVVLTDVEEGTYLYTLTVKNEANRTATDSVEIRVYGDSVVKLETNQGDILLKMMSTIAPKAVENFVTHVQNGYYDGVTFHRVIKGFMIQGGDPTGTGRGGESIWGEPFYNEVSTRVLFDKPFLLAMANAGGTKTNGSQFFITTKEASFLNGKYTIFGSVIDGNETVTKIENVPTSRRDKPLENQTIFKATLYFKK